MKGEAQRPDVRVLSLTYSLADQNFHTTKSVGIFNLSVQLLHRLAAHPGIGNLTVLTNSTLAARWQLPERVRALATERAIQGRFGRIWWDQWVAYQWARHAGNEWLFLPKGFASFLRPCPLKLALFVHDTILESYYNVRVGMSRLERAYFQRCFTANLRQARVIFTNSDFTSQEITRAAKRRGLQPPPLVNVGIGFELPTLTGAEREDTALVLASPFPHKRTDLAVAYLKRWQEQTGYSGRIQWVGNWPAGLALPPLANWAHVARLPEPDYRRALERARALVFFSDYEGFGMPPVEAVLAGVCPVYSELAATQEVMAGAGFAFRNESYESFAKAMHQAWRVAPAQIASWRRELSGRFNWERTANQVVRTLAQHSGIA